MNFIDILKEAPLSAVLKERIALEQAKAEFEITKANERAQTAETRLIDVAAQLEKEKKEHAITSQKLNESLEQIKWLAGQSKAVSGQGTKSRIPKITSFR
jgi:hypothetical protein